MRSDGRGRKADSRIYTQKAGGSNPSPPTIDTKSRGGRICSGRPPIGFRYDIRMSVHLQAVIFDYGNVLCLPQERKEVEAMAALLDSTVASFEAAYWKDRLAFDLAALTPEAYWNGVADRLSRRLSDDCLRLLTGIDNRSWSRPDPVMPSWAAALGAAGLRTAVLSNMPITVRTHLRSVAWMPRFDYSCYSCDLRCAKPAPEIFEDCLRGVGVEPGAALFLDDREENIEAARQLGIHAIHFVSPEQAQREIDERYQLPVRIGFRGAGDGPAG